MTLLNLEPKPCQNTSNLEEKCDKTWKKKNKNLVFVNVLPKNEVKKIGPVTVRRPRLYGQTPPIQNLGTYLQKKARGRALTRAHVHVTCM